ncbi:unnamed protein product [Tenebrio molitor]|nr:unnamed protein product [Tenebrio molitor]
MNFVLIKVYSFFYLYFCASHSKICLLKIRLSISKFTGRIHLQKRNSAKIG